MDDETRANVIAAARSNPILGQLGPLTFARLLESGTLATTSDGDVLIKQGAHSDCAYLILDGEFDIRIETSHGEVQLARVCAGALLGEIGVFAELPRTATVRSSGAGRALCLQRAQLLDAGDSDPVFQRLIIGRLGRQFANFNQAIGLYTNAVSALERDDFDLSILDRLRQPPPELFDFAQSFRRMAEQIVRQRRYHAEMASAAAIQRAMLPAKPPPVLLDGRFEIHAEMKPAREVGGDFYDFFALDDERIVITIGDVCGKGTPAALFMAMTQTVMRVAMRTGTDLESETASANDLLSAGNEEMMFATMFCGVLDVSSGRLDYCNWGHNPPLLIRKNGVSRESLPAGGPPLGIDVGTRCKSGSVTLNVGDLLFLYTDGVTEAENLAQDQFGKDRLSAAIDEDRQSPVQAVVRNVIKRVNEFANAAPQSDDITCVALVRNND